VLWVLFVEEGYSTRLDLGEEEEEEEEGKGAEKGRDEEELMTEEVEEIFKFGTLWCGNAEEKEDDDEEGREEVDEGRGGFSFLDSMRVRCLDRTTGGSST
jgi:hypothetical protein